MEEKPSKRLADEMGDETLSLRTLLLMRREGKFMNTDEMACCINRMIERKHLGQEKARTVF